MDERDRREEELFTRAPLTRIEKKREKYLKKSRFGYIHLDLTSFLSSIKSSDFEISLGSLKLTTLFLSPILTLLVFIFRMGGVTDSFFDEVRSLPLEGADGEQPTSFGSSRGRMRSFKKRKVCH